MVRQRARSVYATATDARFREARLIRLLVCCQQPAWLGNNNNNNNNQLVDHIATKTSEQDITPSAQPSSVTV